MWTVIGETDNVHNTHNTHKDMEGTHAYLILTQEDSSMVGLDDGIYFVLLNFYCRRN